MTLSQEFIRAVDQAEHSTGRVAAENALDKIKQELQGMTDKERREALQFIIQQNQSHPKFPQLSIVGNPAKGNFTVESDYAQSYGIGVEVSNWKSQ